MDLAQQIWTQACRMNAAAVDPLGIDRGTDRFTIAVELTVREGGGIKITGTDDSRSRWLARAIRAQLEAEGRRVAYDHERKVGELTQRSIRIAVEGGDE